MIATLKPIWKQFEETDDTLRHVLAAIPDEKLLWSPGGEAMTITRLIVHTAFPISSMWR